MNESGQTALEHLILYGWSLALVTALVVVLAFVVNNPSSTVTFNSSDPARILMKAGAISNNEATIIVQNATGGIIIVEKAIRSGAYVEPGVTCTFNGVSIPANGEFPSPGVRVVAGGEIYIECTGVTRAAGTVTFEYIDYGSLLRTVTITSVGSIQ